MEKPIVIFDEAARFAEAQIRAFESVAPYKLYVPCCFSTETKRRIMDFVNGPQGAAHKGEDD